MGALARRAVRDAFAKLSPREQAKNPVMLMVYLSAVLTLALFLLSLFGIADAAPGFILSVSAVLWLTVLFANFAEALAEGRGKAQAQRGPAGEGPPCGRPGGVLPHPIGRGGFRNP